MKVAFPTDEHVPFQDDRARLLAMKIVWDFKPDILPVGSDGMDCYNISKFDKNPERVKVDLQKEINRWQDGQKQWAQAARGARRIWIPGNHEERLKRYLWNHPEIGGLEALKAENLLELSSLGIEWNAAIWDTPEIDLGALVIRHGTVIRSKSAYSAMATLEGERFTVSLMIGHTHRGGTSYVTTRKGIVQAVECFCLCKLDPEYVYRPNWQQGIVLAEVVDDKVFIEPIPFHTLRGKKVAHWRGKEYTA